MLFQPRPPLQWGYLSILGSPFPLIPKKHRSSPHPTHCSPEPPKKPTRAERLTDCICGCLHCPPLLQSLLHCPWLSHLAYFRASNLRPSGFCWRLGDNKGYNYRAVYSPAKTPQLPSPCKISRTAFSPASACQHIARAPLSSSLPSRRLSAVTKAPAANSVDTVSIKVGLAYHSWVWEKFWASLVLDLRPGSKSLVDMQLHLAEKNIFHTCSIKQTPNYVCTTILQWVGVFLISGKIWY